jgi:hypothetical protein
LLKFAPLPRNAAHGCRSEEAHSSS